MSRSGPVQRERQRQQDTTHLLRRIALVLLLLLVGSELFLGMLGWRERTLPALLRARAERVDREDGRLTFHPTRLFSTAAEHRRGPGDAGRAPTGAWPFRGRPAEPAPRQLLHVAVLGDSSVHGVQLFEADTLPTLLADALAQRDLAPTRVAVTNYGVPGYTTLQIERLWREVVRGLSPDALVVATALWNDRAPASGPVSQAELLEAARPGLGTRLLPAWSARLDWLAWGGNPLRSPESTEELVAAWRAGRPVYGPLVGREEAVDAIRRVVDDAAGRGVEVVALVPAHPLDSLTNEVGLSADVDALRSALEGAPAQVLEAAAVLAASGLRDGEAFIDAVHPSGPWNRALASAVAERIAPALRERLDEQALATNAPRVVRVSEEVVPAAGDVRLTVVVEGLPRRELPVVLVGGQVLLALERSEVQDGIELVGTLGADRPGEYALLVQSSAGVARADRPLRREAPRLEYVPGSPSDFPRLVVHARPGDRIARLWTGAAGGPAWSLDGDVLLSPGAVPMPVPPGQDRCDASGRASLRLELPPGWPPAPVALQALVVPDGLEPGPGTGLASEHTIVEPRSELPSEAGDG